MLWHLSHLLFVVNAAVVVVAAGQVTKQSGSKISVGEKSASHRKKTSKKKEQQQQSENVTQINKCGNNKEQSAINLNNKFLRETRP